MPITPAVLTTTSGYYSQLTSCWLVTENFTPATEVTALVEKGVATVIVCPLLWLL